MRFLAIIFILSCFYAKGQTRLDSLKWNGDSLLSNLFIEESIKLYEEYIQQDSTNFEVYFGIGNAYSMLGDNDKALSYLEKSISLNSNFSKAYCLRGVINGFNSKMKECFDDLDKAILLDSSFHLAYFYRGQYNLVSGQYNKALDDFNNSIKINPIGQYYFYRANTKVILEMFDSACDDFKKAYEMGYKEAKVIIEENCG